MHFYKHILLLGFIALLPIFAVQNGYASTDHYSYKIMRDGSPVGTYKFNVAYKGEEQHITSQMKVKVKLAFITLYRAKYKANSVYKHGKLVRHTATATYNGKDYTTTYNAHKGNTLTVNGQDFPLQYQPLTFSPFVFLKGHDATFFTEKGKRYNVRYQEVRDERVNISGQSYSAQYSQITGAVKRDLWYGEDGTLLQAKYHKGSSEISLVKEW